MADYGDLSPVIREIDSLAGLVARVDRKVLAVDEKVVAVDEQQQRMLGELAQLRQDLLKFVGEVQRTANIQLAETRIGVLQDEVEHEFGHYKVVRHAAVGILQAFDLGLVTEDLIKNVTQELMVQTPRYWLAPALVALASWTDDKLEECKRAVQEASRRSAERTSLFFSLVLRRQGRQAVAVDWLRRYLRAQETPTALGREFAVVLEAISRGAFGEAGLELIQETFARWRELLAADDAVLDAQVARWRAEIESMSAPSSSNDFRQLATISPEWPTLDAALSRAAAHSNLLTKYSAMLSAEIILSDSIEDTVDDILDQLVTEYDVEELPHRRDLAYQRNIVVHYGDLDAARAASDADAATLQEKIDYMTIQSSAALNPAGIGVSAATQRLAVAACSKWFGQAHASFTQDYRAGLPREVHAQFASHHDFGATTFHLPTWTGSFTTPLTELEESLAGHWNQYAESFLAGHVYHWKKTVILPGLVCVGLLFLLSPINLGFALVAALVGGIWGFVIYSRYDTAQKQRAQMRETLRKARQDSLAQLRGASEELTGWGTRYKTADAGAPTIQALIDSLATVTTEHSLDDAGSTRMVEEDKDEQGPCSDVPDTTDNRSGRTVPWVVTTREPRSEWVTARLRAKVGQLPSWNPLPLGEGSESAIN